MSFHRNPKYQIPELIEALKSHGLEHDTPSQLSDAFRTGWVAALAAQPPAVAAVPEGMPSDVGLKIVSSWLQQEGKAANGDQLYMMCRFADFVLSSTPATSGEATAAPLKVSVLHLGEGDDPFVFQCSGRITAGVLADIDKDLQENRADYFPDGPGTYEFNVTYFDGQYGFEGRCELVPGWVFESTGFEPLDDAAPGNEEDEK